MGNRGKYWVIGILGFLIIILAGVAVAGNRRSRNSVSSTDNPDRQGESWPEVSENTEHYLREQNTILADMIKDMEDLPKSGSAEIDYLNAMISHYQAAASLADSFLKNGGQNPDLIKLARHVSGTQKQEIERMKELAGQLEKGGRRDEKEEEKYLKDFRSAISDLQNRPDDRAGTIDEAFAECMLAHHQVAETLSRSIMHHSREDQVEALADSIRKAQGDEIEQIKKIRKNLTNF